MKDNKQDNKQKVCISCGKQIADNSIVFKCPDCGKQIARCGHCRKLTIAYKCQCGLKGP